MALKHRLWPSLLFFAGLVAVYVGERLVETGRASMIVALSGAGVVLGALLLRRWGARRAPADRWGVARTLAGLYGLGLLALIVHFVSGPLLPWLFHVSLAERLPRLGPALAALWPALLLASVLPVLFVEMSLYGMARAPVLDGRRVRAALLSGLGLAFALVFSFAAAYVAAERNVKADLSTFRTARAGEATRKLVRALDKPTEVTLFFPPANEVAELVAGYFADLKRESALLAVTRLDYALEPRRAKELGVSGNGMVVVSRGPQREPVAVPLTLEQARTKLRALDQEIHKRLILISRGPRVAYFVQGHDERAFSAAEETDKRATVTILRGRLEDLGYVAETLGLAQGLGNAVPENAALVLLLGPLRPLLPAETASLLTYFQRKGRLLVALDPEGGEATNDLLRGMGLRYAPVTLANDRFYWARTRQTADRIGIATGNYAPHAAIAMLGQYGMRLPLVLLGAGHLESVEPPAVKEEPACAPDAGCAPPGGGFVPHVTYTVRSEAGTWNDLNGDFEFNPGPEVRKAYQIGAAVVGRPRDGGAEAEGRAIVLADSDALADDIIINRANVVMAMDAIRWLGGEEGFAGLVSTEEDVPIRHTRQQDQTWFYTSVFAAPILVLGGGFLATRRRRRRAGPAAGARSPEGSP